MKPEHVVILAGVGIVAAYLVARNAKTVAAALGTAAAEAADGAISGTVIGAGKVLGVPETSYRQCQLDKARGDYWAASFSCSASDLFAPVDYSVLPDGIGPFIAANS